MTKQELKIEALRFIKANENRFLEVEICHGDFKRGEAAEAVVRMFKSEVRAFKGGRKALAAEVAMLIDTGHIESIESAILTLLEPQISDRANKTFGFPERYSVFETNMLKLGNRSNLNIRY